MDSASFTVLHHPAAFRLLAFVSHFSRSLFAFSFASYFRISTFDALLILGRSLGPALGSISCSCAKVVDRRQGIQRRFSALRPGHLHNGSEHMQVLPLPWWLV